MTPADILKFTTDRLNNGDGASMAAGEAVSGWYRRTMPTLETVLLVVADLVDRLGEDR